MNTNEDTGEFQGTTINFATEYHEARKLMGTKGTDMEELSYTVGLLYVNTPNKKWTDAYAALLQEIEMRTELLATLH